jgi:hypothetical protein
MYPDLYQKNRRMSTCNRLDLQTIGSQPIMPKILLDHRVQRISRFSQVLLVRVGKEIFAKGASTFTNLMVGGSR